MIITILCILALAASIILFFAFEDADVAPFICILVGVPALFGVLFGVTAGIVNAVNYDLDHMKAEQERSAIVYRMEMQKEDASVLVNGGVYNDAVEFNAKVRADNKWGKNPWTNWYYGWAYADLDEIDLSQVFNAGGTR